MADALAPLGIAPTDRDARIPRLLKRLGETRDAVGAWLETTTAGADTNEIDGLGRFVAAGMTAAHDAGRLLLARTRTVAKDPVSLLRQWVAAPRETLPGRLHLLADQTVLDALGDRNSAPHPPPYPAALVCTPLLDVQ